MEGGGGEIKLRGPCFVFFFSPSGRGGDFFGLGVGDEGKSSVVVCVTRELLR